MEISSKKDLDFLIENKINESTNLEYKDPKSLENNGEIAKDISAMANSDGGVIVYGLLEESKDHAPTKIEWMANHQLKEKIEQVAQTRIRPSIEQLKILPILNPENDKEFILVVSVPKSDKAPHQASPSNEKKGYWRRQDYTIRHMEHYEIEDLFFKRKRPILEINFKRLSAENPMYEIRLVNKGKIIGEKVCIKIIVPWDLTIRGNKWLEVRGEGLPTLAISHTYQYFENGFPLYPDLPSTIGILEFSKELDYEEIGIGFFLVCKDSEIKAGSAKISYNKAPEISYLEGPHNEVPQPYIKDMWGDMRCGEKTNFRDFHVPDRNTTATYF